MEPSRSRLDPEPEFLRMDGSESSEELRVTTGGESSELELSTLMISSFGVLSSSYAGGGDGVGDESVTTNIIYRLCLHTNISWLNVPSSLLREVYSLRHPTIWSLTNPILLEV